MLSSSSFVLRGRWKAPEELIPGLSERRAQAILDMRLQSLTGLQRENWRKSIVNCDGAYYQGYWPISKIMAVVKRTVGD